VSKPDQLEIPVGLLRERARSSGTIGGMGIPLRPASDEIIRIERRALLRAVTARVLRETNREVVRTR